MFQERDSLSFSGIFSVPILVWCVTWWSHFSVEPRYRAAPADIRDQAHKTEVPTHVRRHSTPYAEPMPDNMPRTGRAKVCTIEYVGSFSLGQRPGGPA
jgi:hypothetical protein